MKSFIVANVDLRGFLRLSHDDASENILRVASEIEKNDRSPASYQAHSPRRESFEV